MIPWQPIAAAPFDCDLEVCVIDKQGDHLLARVGDRRELSDLLVRHHQLDYLSPSCHGAIPRSANRKRGIREQNIRSSSAGFMESVV
jgi:hypothetical protein